MSENMYTVRTLQKGETLIKAGGLEPYIYLLKSGQLIVSKETKSGAIRHLGFINPGEFVGEMAYLSERYTNSSTVLAVEESAVIEILADNFYEVLAKNPVWLKALIKSLVHRIENLNSKV
jgi:CRP/FNR family transcriptional regulator, cyclic AMP receptor protein